MKILGFDLGDGESAVTIYEDQSTIEPPVVPLHGRTSMISAVGIKNGRIVVGEEASVLLGAENTRVRFKSRYLTDPEAATDVRMFAQGVFALLMKSESAAMAEVGRTVVGCPAGWGERRREQYAALIESAGFPNVTVVPESRAAFLYARHARGLKVDPQLLSHSAMVIDVGSSTTDFAYIVDGHQQDLSLFGDANLGGGLLDEIILDRCIERSRDRDALSRVMKESKAWRSYCELEARRIKEQYFLDEEKWAEVPLRKRIVVCYDDTLSLELSLDRAMMDEIIHAPLVTIGGRSFVKCLDDALQAALQVSRDNPPQAVILTGGASRMAFLQESVRKAFGDSLIVLCPEPECSIARGLAYCGRVDENLKIFRQEVTSIFRGEILSEQVNASIHELYTPISEVLYKASVESVADAVALWRKGGIDTIEQLDQMLEQKIPKDFTSEKVKKELEVSIRVWLDNLMRSLESQLNSLCVRCGIPPEHMSLRNAQVDPGLEGVELSLMDAMGMDVISGILGVVLAAIGAAICGGGGIALVGSGPVGMIAGAAAGMLLAILGKSTMEKALKSVKIPLLMRRVVTDKAVRRGLARQEEEIEKEIIQALADPRNGFATRLCASLASTLGLQMEKMAQDAEMSITA